jgi:hypothetical protein
MRTIFISVAALAITALCTATATAQDAPTEANIAGQWSFTADIRNECSFGGTANLQHIGNNKYKGELTARQSCLSLPEDYLVRQQCDASVSGNQVSVRCTIAEFINGFESEYYYPDNFALTIVSSDRLFGSLVSAGAPNPAEWKRAEGGIS